MVRHHLDFILDLIDPVTQEGVIGLNQFELNGIAIKPPKRMGRYFIFVNVLKNHRYMAINEPLEEVRLIWRNLNYKTLSLSLDQPVITCIVEPSRQYPFKLEHTQMILSAEAACQVTFEWPSACGRFHLVSAEKGREEIELKSTRQGLLSGRRFLVKEGDRQTLIQVVSSERKCLLDAPLDDNYSVEAIVTELCHYELSAGQECIVFVPKWDDKHSELTIDLTCTFEGNQKPLTVNIRSGEVNNVTLKNE